MKKISAAVVCVLIAALFACQASALGTLSSSKVSFKDGMMVKCGKYLVTAAYSTKSGKISIIRTDAHGKKKKTVATVSSCAGISLAQCGSSVYYRKGTKIYSYDPKVNVSEKFFDLDPEGRDKNSKSAMLGVCPEGIVYRDSAEKVILHTFGNEDKTVADGKGKYGAYTYLGATDDNIFCYRAEKKSDGRYLCSLYRYSLTELSELKKVSTFNTVKKPYAVPCESSMHVFKNKLIFTVGAAGKNGAFEGCVYSASPDGTGVKKLKEGVNSSLSAGKNSLCLTGQDSKGNFTVYKISSKGKLTTSLNYAKLTMPVLTYSTENGKALAINTSDSYYYDLYLLPAVKKCSGTRLIRAKSIPAAEDTGNLYVGVHIYDSVENTVSLSYSVYVYDHNGNYVRTARCINYLVNTETGKKSVLQR